MSIDENRDFCWPPRGWKKLDFIRQLNGQAIVKDPRFATIKGVYYQIQPLSIFDKDNDKKAFAYRLDINGWTYSIHNENQEFNILSFVFREKRQHKSKNKYLISDIKTKSRPILLNNRSAGRSTMAAILMIKQIIGGKVPDYNRILRLYKIHPSQRSLYALDYERENSLNCGLVPFGISDSHLIKRMSED